MGIRDKNSENNDDNAEGEIPGAAEEEKKDWSDATNWVNFIKALLYYFVVTLLIGLFGSGFIYLTTRGNEIDIILPTYDEYYNAQRYKVDKSGPYHTVDCSEVNSIGDSIFESNFPYNLKKEYPNGDKTGVPFSERLLNWFARTIEGTMKSNRTLLKSWLDIFTPNTPLGNHTLQIYLGMPMTLFFGWISLFTGFGFAFGAGISADMKVSVWGMILMYFWGLTGALAVYVYIRLIATVCLLPISQNWKEISNIMACNVKTLVVLFGFFACGVAYDTLDPDVASVMGVVYLLLVIITVWRGFQQKVT
jgi:hypothetical protein